jgi:TPP-dependent pyruvate/acetoin dehydrogenase alpha subunit
MEAKSFLVEGHDGIRPPGAGVFKHDPRIYGLSGDSNVEIVYRQMLGIRRFEESLLELFEKGVLNGTTHCCIGQEANCVSVISHLNSGDHVFSNHRCHGHYLSWTGDTIGLLAEIMGKSAGVCKGIGGSQHLCVPGFKSNGILGGTVANAAGIALAQQIAGKRSISVVFAGDGAFGEGIIYETLNLAALWKLPLLVVVENNEWSQSTPIKMNFSGSFIGRFSAFNIECEQVNSGDPSVIHAAAERAVNAIRSNQGPRGLVINTYRFCHHSKNDDNRDSSEVEKRKNFDPLRIQSNKVETGKQSRINADVEAAIQDCIRSALLLK